MIARLWHGWTEPDKADEYQQLLEREVLPGIETKAQGYKGVYVMRRSSGAEVEFITLTLWDSWDAIRSLVGDDVETAYVPEEAQKVLARFDKRSVHYDLVLEAG